MRFLENLRRKGWNRPVVRSTRRRPLMEDLESRVVMSSNVFSGGTGDDVILLRRDPNNAAALEVKITQGTKTTTDVSLAVVASASPRSRIRSGISRMPTAVRGPMS